MRALLLLLIRLYQRHISPHKGFSCAYRVHTGRAGCSALGYRAVRRHGVFTGLGLIRARTRRCGVAQRRYGSAAARVALATQRGDCDVGCPADLPCDGPGRSSWGICDWLNCCDCCDWPERKKKRRRDPGGARGDLSAHLPPRREPRGTKPHDWR
ncbi:MAG: membrane protein insertion efficiency factor YidD [Roseateles sp.]|uniref:membrane protein insertion efficiency factor YidD n=1 Tax=Roseateles sp. TaxID=1971397 RepID=UPI004035EEDE